MNDGERFADAVHRLAKYGYEVLTDEHGYIVRHLTDADDVSCTRNLDELVDLADLMAWAEQRRASRSDKQPK